MTEIKKVDYDELLDIVRDNKLSTCGPVKARPSDIPVVAFKLLTKYGKLDKDGMIELTDFRCMYIADSFIKLEKAIIIKFKENND